MMPGTRSGGRPSTHLAVAGCCLVLAMVAAALGAPPPARGQAAPPTQAHRAINILPPGNSGFVSAEGQAAGMAGGDPADYGAHLDDQRDLYWRFGTKPGDFRPDEGPAEEPTPGVRIRRDEFGVPGVWADTGRGVWFGAGYVAAQDRLFLMDAVRRLGRGTFAELTGPSGIPADVQTRTLTYSAEEYAAFFARLSPTSRDAVEGYVEGINAYLDEIAADPSLLPAEYGLLTTQPEPWEVIDILAGGVFITRAVASEGGNEMANVAALRTLEEQYGREAGRGMLRDLVWDEDRRAATTVPPGEAEFPGNAPAPTADRDAAFDAMADYALTIPPELATGQGTGAFTAPGSEAPLPGGGAADPGAQLGARAVATLQAWADGLGGGSIAMAVAPERTRDGGALLMSGPQLGYSYPTQLYELEVHGGGYDARGVGVPGLPTVGIGYGERTAWALTTGYSKTIDSFIETTRPNPTPGGPPQVLHDGTWTDQSCRTETVRYRQSVMGAPVGPPAQSLDVEVCRTGHGPVVAETADGTRARSLQYAMWGRELETVEGTLAWNRVDDLAGFTAAVRQVTWNENVTYADADGHIAYWHPGLYPARAPQGDQRFPLPGTGEADHRGMLPFEALPQSVDPVQGYLANWNTLPARGWASGEGIAPTSRPGGAGQRVTAAAEQLEATDDLTLEGLAAVEQRAGITDPRARELLPAFLALAGDPGLGERERAAVALLAGWDRSHYGPFPAEADLTDETLTDGPGATVFGALVLALREELFAELPDELVARQTGVGSHVFDASPLDNLAARVVAPERSALRPSRDYTGGRGTAAVLRAALTRALDALAAEHGSDDLDDYRRVHPRSDVCSLTGVIGPCLTMPYQDRGSWIHLVGFDAPATPPAVDRVSRVAGDDRVATAVALSAATFGTAGGAVLARADAFPDALAAGPLAAALGGPVLLTPSDRLDPRVAAELARLAVRRVHLAGGSSALAPAVADALRAAGLEVVRLEGADRFATAVAVADELAEVAGPLDDAIVARADGFADALAATPLAGFARAPILLTPTDALDATTAAALDRLLPDAARTWVVGGEQAVGPAVLSALGPGAVRVAGATRYDTAVAVADAALGLGADPALTLVASGAAFPDALGAGAAAYHRGGVLVLVEPGAIPAATTMWLGAHQLTVDRVLVVGGTQAVSTAVENESAVVLR